MPRFMASEVPIMETASSMLLQILTAPPVPTAPQWVIWEGGETGEAGELW